MTSDVTHRRLPLQSKAMFCGKHMMAVGCLMMALFAPALLLAQATKPADRLRDNYAWQIALEKACYSPGLVDGKIGPKTIAATAAFQQAHGLEAIGKLDEATRQALQMDSEHALTTYTVVAADLEGITPHNPDWNQRALQAHSDYFTIADGLTEKFHTSLKALKALNPGVDVENPAVGVVLNVPNLERGVAPKTQSLQVELAKKQILALDAEGKVVGLFHCSIAANVEKRPSGETTVVVIAPNPDYTFDPKYWPEVTNVDHKLIIPPGPRNPVGLCWIGLDLPGYGMHGTPWPEMIGKTGSHGCFRLTNWDALRLAKMARVGMKVVFVAEK